MVIAIVAELLYAAAALPVAATDLSAVSGKINLIKEAESRDARACRPQKCHLSAAAQLARPE
jgi:hypothetical protein